jgi:glucoamylase
MQNASAQPAAAPGAPGVEPRWSPSVKEGVGTAYHTGCRLWFTLSRGIVSEVYCPTVDTPSTRDLQFLITDGQTFCHEETRDLQHDLAMPERDALFYRLTNREPNGRYRLIKHVLTDPHASVLLIHTRLEIFDEALRGKLRLYALLAPHLAGRGADNRAAFLDLGERTLLRAERAGLHLVFGCDRGFCRRSVGHVGASDGWTDLHKGNFQLDWEYQEAGPGNVALTGEVNLPGMGDRNFPGPTLADGGHGAEFILGVAFGASMVSAAAKLLQAFAMPFERHRAAYVAQWQRAAPDPKHERGIAERTGDDGSLWRLSRGVLLAHEDKEFQGAMIASLSTPWGEIKSDADRGGYHLVWTRDLVQSASALLATGQVATPLRALLWLTCIQKPDGAFPQNSWIDGTPYWQGIQLDEMAAPLLLGWRLWQAAPEAFDLAVFRPVLARACAYLIAAGPVTAQDRWEENAGYSPFTLATMIAALCAGAELGRAHGLAAADFALAYADWLNAHLEDWCVTTRGDLLPDKPRHYVRLTPADPLAPDPHPDPDALTIQVANGGGTHPARRIVGGDFLHLVRLGIRPADDPLIRDSVAVLDAVLKRDLPGGPSWRRYPFDGYGQKADGTAFDGTGEGRCWPLLTGERGYYELAAGRDPRPFIVAMERFASAGGLMPEQVWDADDLPSAHLVRGRPTGSATPLCWSHAEYLSLVCSARAGRVVDRIEPAFRRYVEGGKRDSRYEMWTFRHRTRRVPAARTLRLVVRAPAIVRWSVDGWTNAGEAATAPVGFGGLHHLDLPTAGLAAGAQVEWTFFWPEGNRWEGGENFRAAVV